MIEITDAAACAHHGRGMDDAMPTSEACRDPAVCLPAGPAGRPSAKPLALNTFRENVIVLASTCAAVRPERLMGLRKLEVRANGVSLLASPMISDDPALVGPFEVGLPQPAFRRLRIRPGDAVEVTPTRSPRTLAAIRAKIAGETLSDADYAAIARIWRTIAGPTWRSPPSWWPAGRPHYRS